MMKTFCDECGQETEPVKELELEGRKAKATIQVVSDSDICVNCLAGMMRVHEKRKKGGGTLGKLQRFSEALDENIKVAFG